MAQQKSKLVESLVSYVEEHRSLNDSIDIKSIKGDVKSIDKDPQQYALDLIEVNFVANIKKFIKAYELGDAFAKDLLKNAEDQD